MRKNDDPLRSASAIAALGDETHPVGASPAIRAADMIAGLKERLVGLHGQMNNGHALFRLSYSILSLENCLEEKGMMGMSLDKAPGIHAIIGRIDGEISALTLQTAAPFPSLFGAIAHLTRQLAETSERLPVAPDHSELVRLMVDVQKSITADGRRHYASQAALHASIERLSERLEQMEARLAPPKDQLDPHTPAREMVPHMTRDPSPIDPRPMLKAARAAAARALTDIENAPITSTFPTLGSTPSDQPPLRRRRWGFSFAAA